MYQYVHDSPPHHLPLPFKAERNWDPFKASMGFSDKGSTNRPQHNQLFALLTRRLRCKEILH